MTSGDLTAHATHCRKMADACARDLKKADESSAVLDQAVDRLRREHALWTQLADETEAYLAAADADEPSLFG